MSKQQMFPDAPDVVYEWVAEELTAVLEAGDQPLVTSFPRGGRLKTSYRVEVDREGWHVVIFADFVSEAVENTTTPGEPLSYRGLYVSHCRHYNDDGAADNFTFHPRKFARYFSF